MSEDAEQREKAFAYLMEHGHPSLGSVPSHTRAAIWREATEAERGTCCKGGIAALREDAERYRYLRASTSRSAIYVRSRLFDGRHEYVHGGNLDRAIDAAREKGKPI